VSILTKIGEKHGIVKILYLNLWIYPCPGTCVTTKFRLLATQKDLLVTHVLKFRNKRYLSLKWVMDKLSISTKIMIINLDSSKATMKDTGVTTSWR